MDLIPRMTVERVCAVRNLSLDGYREAYRKLSMANSCITSAVGEFQSLHIKTSRYNRHIKDDGYQMLLLGMVIPEEEKYMEDARRLVDTQVWSHLIEMTDIEHLMDKKAKDEFNSQILQDPPEATEENVYSTLQSLILDADNIFKRGIAECFSNLDRRFKSHDGWKIGSRIILNRAFDDYGMWNYHTNLRDTLQDVERPFYILDQRKPPQNYAGIIGAIEEARKGFFGAKQSMTENEYFRIRCFLNGNLHIWFKRNDLVRKVNKLLGEYYGNAIPAEEAPDNGPAKNDRKTSLAKNFGFFPTPVAVGERVIDSASLYQRDEQLTVLEPSAGSGNLARLAAKTGALVDCVEIHKDRCVALKNEGRYRNVYRADFLTVHPKPEYDRVILNPPFDRERDIDHVMHALDFLKPDGILVAIMSAGTEVRETKKSQSFRNMVKRMNGSWYNLPERSFSEVGTNVNTVVVKIRKDGRPAY